MAGKGNFEKMFEAAIEENLQATHDYKCMKIDYNLLKRQLKNSGKGTDGYIHYDKIIKLLNKYVRGISEEEFHGVCGHTLELKQEPCISLRKAGIAAQLGPDLSSDVMEGTLESIVWTHIQSQETTLKRYLDYFKWTEKDAKKFITANQYTKAITSHAFCHPSTVVIYKMLNIDIFKVTMTTKQEHISYKTEIINDPPTLYYKLFGRYKLPTIDDLSDEGVVF